MPSGLYYEGTTFPVPHHVVNERIEQLKQVIPQFYALENLFSRGRYLPFRWAFFCSKEMIKNNTVIYRIELLDMKTEMRSFRNWEVKGNLLVSDTKNDEKDPFILTGALYIGWWQTLVGEGLLYPNNILLAKAMEVGMRESPQKYSKTQITSANIRIRSIMGKTVQGFDFELYVDFSDDRKKPNSVKWVLDCDKDIKDGILIETEPESVTFHENSPNFKAEKERLITNIREQLIEDGKQVKSGDWIIDQYYISSLVLNKKGYRAVVSLVFMSQMGNTKLFEVNCERLNHEYIIHKCEALVFDFSIVDFIEEKGDKFNIWQSFSKKACVLYNPCIKKLAEVGALSQHGSKVVECTRAQCRVRRGASSPNEEENDLELGSFTGFDFILIMRVREPKGIVTTQEWKITGNPCGEEDYKLQGIRKFKPNRSVTPSMDMSAFAQSKDLSRSPSPAPLKTEKTENSVLQIPSSRTPQPQRPTHRRTETEKKGISNDPIRGYGNARRRLPPPMREHRVGDMDRTFENFPVDKGPKMMEIGKIRDILGRSPRK
jgi:hypothetical protein